MTTTVRSIDFLARPTASDSTPRQPVHGVIAFDSNQVCNHIARRMCRAVAPATRYKILFPVGRVACRPARDWTRTCAALPTLLHARAATRSTTSTEMAYVASLLTRTHVRTATRMTIRCRPPAGTWVQAGAAIERRAPKPVVQHVRSTATETIRFAARQHVVATTNESTTAAM